MTFWQMLTTTALVRSAADTNSGSGAPQGGEAGQTPQGGEGGQTPQGGEGGQAPQGGEGGQAPGGNGGGGGQMDLSWFADDPTPEERRTLEAKQFKTPRDLMKSLRSAEKMIRGDQIPGPPDNPEERSKWFAEQVAPRLGVPDSVEGYEIGKPEFSDDVAPYVQFDDERQSRFLGKAHELGLTPDQAKGVLDLYAEETSGDVQRHMERAQADQTEMQSELKREWGQSYDQNLRAAVETAKEFGIDEQQAEALRSGNVMGSAALAKAMHELAQLRGDDSMKGGGKPTPAQTKEQAQKALTEFQSRNGEALTKRTHQSHEWAVDELRRLQRAAGIGSAAREQR